MLPAILTLNISRPPVQRARLLLDYLWHREEELLVLTETGRGGGSELIGQVCRAAGYAVEPSLHAPDGRRRPGLSATSLGVLVVGDLNIVAPGHRDALPYVLPEETTAYEVLTSGLGLVDVYAAAHVGSPDAAEPSWVDHSGAGCRYDYVLATADVAPGVWTACLDQTPRTRGLTDHGALAASLS